MSRYGKPESAAARLREAAWNVGERRGRASRSLPNQCLRPSR
jgi:hypothetical protein